METTAEQFIERLTALQSPNADRPDDFSGVGMGQIFGLARECMDMSSAVFSVRISGLACQMPAISIETVSTPCRR